MNHKCPVQGCGNNLKGTQIFCTVCMSFMREDMKLMLDGACHRLRSYQDKVIRERRANKQPLSDVIKIPQPLAMDYTYTINVVGRSIVYYRNVDALATEAERLESICPYQDSTLYHSSDLVSAIIRNGRLKEKHMMLLAVMRQCEAVLKMLSRAFEWYSHQQIIHHIVEVETKSWRERLNTLLSTASSKQ